MPPVHAAPALPSVFPSFRVLVSSPDFCRAVPWLFPYSCSVRLQAGLSGKSIDNYIYVLRKAYTGVFPSFTPLEHTAVYRSCFPVPSFYHIYSKCADRLHFL
ncbi:MAG: hypothetical protein IJT42_05955 [Treponema sp.]|nr:hypothetical protein [Treponema sp.]